MFSDGYWPCFFGTLVSSNCFAAAGSICHWFKNFGVFKGQLIHIFHLDMVYGMCHYPIAFKLSVTACHCWIRLSDILPNCKYFSYSTSSYVCFSPISHWKPLLKWNQIFVFFEMGGGREKERNHIYYFTKWTFKNFSTAFIEADFCFRPNWVDRGFSTAVP